MNLFTTETHGAKFTRVTQMHGGVVYSTLFSFERTRDDILHFARVTCGLLMYPFDVDLDKYQEFPSETARKFKLEELV
jgi:hypothetical protein